MPSSSPPSLYMIASASKTTAVIAWIHSMSSNPQRLGGEHVSNHAVAAGPLAPLALFRLMLRRALQRVAKHALAVAAQVVVDAAEFGIYAASLSYHDRPAKLLIRGPLLLSHARRLPCYAAIVFQMLLNTTTSVRGESIISTPVRFVGTAPMMPLSPPSITTSTSREMWISAPRSSVLWYATSRDVASVTAAPFVPSRYTFHMRR